MSNDNKWPFPGKRVEELAKAAAGEVILSGGLKLNQAGTQELLERLKGLTPGQLSKLMNQADIRAFDTNAALPGGVPVNPLRMQLIAHFDTLSEYAQRVAVDQLASLARLCAKCPKE